MDTLTLQALAKLSDEELAVALTASSRQEAFEAAIATADDAVRGHWAERLAALVSGGWGEPRARLWMGVQLGGLGDPRLSSPTDEGYWAAVELKSGETVRLGRHLVTNREFQSFVASGGYNDDANWSEEGLAWRNATADTWPELAKRDGVDDFLVDNQPVVGVTYYEAEAFAAGSSARLPRWYERVRAVRGAEKRPYPWGSPFGEGNTNSKEEVLMRPCAVGLYAKDCTPEGIYDLAGNVAEWVGEQSGSEQFYHPGSYDQPSLACWAKAMSSQRRDARWGGLGFRLARD